MKISMRLNGEDIVDDVPDHVLLVDYLRDSRMLQGTKVSCHVQVCGACTVLVDGLPVSSCCFLTADANGAEVVTIEGLRDLPEYVALAAAFLSNSAAQCGFCTPGFLIAAFDLVANVEPKNRQEVQSGLSGNICRCTGYRAIIDAVAEVAGAS